MQDELASRGSKFTGRLVFPDSPDYESARVLWARQFSTFPLVIVFCQNVQNVVNAISWCREHDIAFRARSGRHALEGWSSLDGGVVIDVSDMNQIHVDERAGVATVQTGATQGAVVDALGRIGYTIPSGGEVDPGIAGVLLGGGIGLLARSMGLACDHLLGVEMVIPSGKQGAQVIRADEHNNADLLWASRGGGGGNFGIATSFTLDIRPISTVTIYEATWDWQHLSELLSVWQDLAPSADERLDSVLVAASKAAGTITSYGIIIFSLLFSVVAAFGAGRISDKVGPKRTLLATLAVWTVGLMAVTFAWAPWVLFVAAPLLFFAMGATLALAPVLLIALSPTEKLTEFMGLYVTIGMLSSVIGPAIVALLLGVFGGLGTGAYRIGMSSLAVATVLAFFLLLLRVPDARPPDAST